MKTIKNKSVKVISIGTNILLPEESIKVADAEINASVKILETCGFIEISNFIEEKQRTDTSQDSAVISSHEAENISDADEKPSESGEKTAEKAAAPSKDKTQTEAKPAVKKGVRGKRNSSKSGK